MKDRLELARELLADDGVIFVSIDDNEQAYLKVLMDEIFGEENFVNLINWISNKKGRQISGRLFSKTFEYILVYSKSDNFKEHEIDRKFAEKIMPNIYDVKELNILQDEKSKFIIQNELHNTNINKFNIKTRPNLYFPIYTNGIDISIHKKDNYIKLLPPKNLDGLQGVWRWSKEKVERDKLDLYIVKNKDAYQIFTKKRNMNYSTKDIILSSLITTKSGSNELNRLKINFDYSKPSLLIKFLLMSNDKDISILDFFAGSGTTAQAVMELNEEDGGNRRFILCTNNENNIATDICRERIYRVINGKGSKNEIINWKYSDDKKSLNNNSMKYLRVKPIHKINGDYEDINDMEPIYVDEFDKDYISIKDFK